MIDASPDVVWAILTRGEGYAEWNPEILSVEGRFALNQRIKVSVRLGNGAICRLWSSPYGRRSNTTICAGTLAVANRLAKIHASD